MTTKILLTVVTNKCKCGNLTIFLYLIRLPVHLSHPFIMWRVDHSVKQELWRVDRALWQHLVVLAVVKCTNGMDGIVNLSKIELIDTNN